MISKVKSQGKRTTELRVAGRARFACQPTLSNSRQRRQAKGLPYAIYFTHPLNSESGAVSETGTKPNGRHPPEAGDYRMRAANKRERAGSVRYLADAPGRWRKGLRRLRPSLCCYSRTS